MSFPLISVVVPSYNHAHFIRQTLDSVLEQGYPALQLVVVDGGSQDGTAEILKAYASDLYWWVSEPDRGQTDALIKGFSRTTGDIQCWLNSDDLLEPWTLAEVGAWFARNPSGDVVFGDMTWIDESGRELRAQREIPFNRFIWMHTYNYVPGMSTFWRRHVYEAVGGLDARFNLAMDADLWIRMADITKLHHVRRSWSRMRFYASQKNLRLREASDREDQRIRARYWKTERPPMLTARRAVAQAIRIAWKAATGCYTLGYVRDLRTVPKP